MRLSVFLVVVLTQKGSVYLQNGTTPKRDLHKNACIRSIPEFKRQVTQHRKRNLRIQIEAERDFCSLSKMHGVFVKSPHFIRFHQPSFTWMSSLNNQSLLLHKSQNFAYSQIAKSLAEFTTRTTLRCLGILWLSDSLDAFEQSEVDSRFISAPKSIASHCWKLWRRKAETEDKRNDLRLLSWSTNKWFQLFFLRLGFDSFLGRKVGSDRLKCRSVALLRKKSF